MTVTEEEAPDAVLAVAGRLAGGLAGEDSAPVTALRAAGLVDLAQPRDRPLDPMTLLRVCEEVAHADGSAGWLLAGAQYGALLHWAGPRARTEVGGPQSLVTGSARPGGSLLEKDGEYRLSGRWQGIPGAADADWFALFTRHEGTGEDVAVLLPADSVRLGGPLPSIGLTAAGCRDVHVDAYPLREDQVVDPFGPPATPGSLPVVAAGRQAAVAVALGVARAALRDFVTSARHRSRLGSLTRMAEQPLLQKELNHVTLSFRAARELLIAETRRLPRTAAALAAIPYSRRVDLAAAQLHAQQAAHAAVRFAFTKAGGSALYTGHPLERRWRDSETIAQQHVFGARTERYLAEAQFGNYVPAIVL